MHQPLSTGVFPRVRRARPTLADGSHACTDAPGAAIRGRGNRGFVLAMTAILLVPLLLFAGFATDLGSWYHTASKVQRAADAAALAGVVWLPDEAAAEAAALEAAELNGFVDGVDGVNVSVDRIGGQQLQVTIGAPVDQFFTQLVMDSFDINRASTAEYVLPVPMGSPTNTLGTGNLGNNENFWLAVSGYCASKEQGDLLMPVSDANWTSASNPPSGSNWSACTGGNTVVNDDYDERGYWYAVKLDADAAFNVDVQVYDASRRRCHSASQTNPGRGCRSNNASYYVGDSAEFTTPSGSGESWSGSNWTGGYQTTTRFVLHDQVVGFDFRSSPVLATLTAANNDGNYQGRWVTVGTLSNPTKGIYPLQVFTLAGQNGRTSNAFAVRAVPQGSPNTVCSTIVGDPNYLASCPQVHGLEHMGILANLTDAAAGTGQASFYLAQVNDKHAGKMMEINLWDPGEGASRLEILDPNGNPATFDWETQCGGGIASPTGGCSANNVTQLTVSGSNMTQPGPYRLSSSRYSDRLMRIYVDLPNDFTPYAGKEWWKIRYTVAGSPTDRTTWSVRILGDPVHLIPNP